jgi:2-keto-4-pentenoate hydratase
VAAAFNQTETLADRLVEAYRTGSRLQAEPATGPADIDQAYAVQREVWRRLAGDVRPNAWKVGAASIHANPIAAPVLPARLAIGPARFARALFTEVGIEAEIALCFGRDLPARETSYGLDEILPAIATAHVAMEVVDTRLADADAAGPHWRLADSLLNGALVIGDAIPGWRSLDWRGLAIRISLDGRTLDERQARPPLDDLFHCLPWWLNHVGGARAGDIVTTGAWTGMHPAGESASMTVSFTGMGKAELRIS